MSKSNEKQVGGSHYQHAEIQHWDFAISQNLGYMEGQITKYVCRWRDKGGLEDLCKAQHFLEKLIEFETKRAVEQLLDEANIGDVITKTFQEEVEMRDTDLRPTTGPNASLDMADVPPCPHPHTVRSPDGKHVCTKCGAAT